MMERTKTGELGDTVLTLTLALQPWVTPILEYSDGVESLRTSSALTFCTFSSVCLLIRAGFPLGTLLSPCDKG